MILKRYAAAALALALTAFVFCKAEQQAENRVKRSVAVYEATKHLGGIETTSTEENPTAAVIRANIETLTEAGNITRYEITADERAIIEAVVAAEALGEDFDGQALVAQCILNTAEARGMRPDDVVLERGQYAAPDYTNGHMVAAAVSAVFDDGYTVTDEPIRYFYAPAWCSSEWHESLTFVIEHGGHRFFAEA